MGLETADLDEQIERLRKGDTLLESEVRALCEKVRLAFLITAGSSGHFSFRRANWALYTLDSSFRAC